jgi:fructoselysine-6-P-deglycase FrlB-like protein
MGAATSSKDAAVHVEAANSGGGATKETIANGKGSEVVAITNCEDAAVRAPAEWEVETLQKREQQWGQQQVLGLLLWWQLRMAKMAAEAW